MVIGFGKERSAQKAVCYSKIQKILYVIVCLRFSGNLLAEAVIDVLRLDNIAVVPNFPDLTAKIPDSRAGRI